VVDDWWEMALLVGIMVLALGAIVSGAWIAIETSKQQECADVRR
jgi:hypothetical protein